MVRRKILKNRDCEERRNAWKSEIMAKEEMLEIRNLENRELWGEKRSWRKKAERGDVLKLRNSEEKRNLGNKK